MHILVGVSLVSFLVSGPSTPSGPITPDLTDAVHEWPAVKLGVWSIDGTWTAKGKSKGKKSRHWTSTTKRCDDVTSLFQGYWGRGKADKDSCLFQSTKLSASKFEIIGECLVDKYDVVKSETIVTTKGQSSFEMEVQLQEGKIEASAKEVGHWVSACTEADKTHPDKAPADKATVDNKTPPTTATADKSKAASTTTAEGNPAH